MLRSAEEYSRSTVVPSKKARAIQEAIGMEGGGGGGGGVTTPSRSRISLLGGDDAGEGGAGEGKGNDCREKGEGRGEGWEEGEETEGQPPGVIGRYLPREDVPSTAKSHPERKEKVPALTLQGVWGAIYGTVVGISAALWWAVYIKGLGFAKIEARGTQPTRPHSPDS